MGVLGVWGKSSEDTAAFYSQAISQNASRWFSVLSCALSRFSLSCFTCVGTTCSLVSPATFEFSRAYLHKAKCRLREYALYLLLALIARIPTISTLWHSLRVWCMIGVPFGVALGCLRTGSTGHEAAHFEVTGMGGRCHTRHHMTCVTHTRHHMTHVTHTRHQDMCHLDINMTHTRH